MGLSPKKMPVLAETAESGRRCLSPLAACKPKPKLKPKPSGDGSAGAQVRSRVSVSTAPLAHLSERHPSRLRARKGWARALRHLETVSRRDDRLGHELDCRVAADTGELVSFPPISKLRRSHYKSTYAYIDTHNRRNPMLSTRMPNR